MYFVGILERRGSLFGDPIQQSQCPSKKSWWVRSANFWLFWTFEKSSSYLITQQRRELFTTWNNLIYTLVRWRIWRESFGYGRSERCGSCGCLEVRLTLNTSYRKESNISHTIRHTIILFGYLSKKNHKEEISTKSKMPISWSWFSSIRWLLCFENSLFWNRTIKIKLIVCMHVTFFMKTIQFTSLMGFKFFF